MSLYRPCTVHVSIANHIPQQYVPSNMELDAYTYLIVVHADTYYSSVSGLVLQAEAKSVFAKCIVALPQYANEESKLV